MGHIHNRKRTRSRPRSRAPFTFDDNYLYDPVAPSPLEALPTSYMSRAALLPASVSYNLAHAPKLPSPLATVVSAVQPPSNGSAGKGSNNQPASLHQPRHHGGRSKRTSSYSDAVEESTNKRRRIFGSDSGDEGGELCGPMLKVVWHLFDGGFDFDDDFP